MKRVVSFDALRGLAIFMVLFIHICFFLLDANWPRLLRPEGTPFPQVIPYMLLLYFPAWGGFFLMISAAVHSYVYSKRVEQGVNMNALLQRQFFSGTILLSFAIVLDILFSPYGFLFTSYIEKRWAFERIYMRIYHIETVHTIAVSIILSSIILYVLFSINGYGETSLKKNVITIVFLIILVYIFTPFMHDFVNSFSYEWAYQEHPLRNLRIAFANILKFFLVYLGSNAGEPVFPYFGSALIGTLIGLLISQPSLPRKTPLFLASTGVLIKSIALLLPLTGYFSLYPLTRENFTWYLFCVGGQIMMIALFLWLIEFGIAHDFMIKATTMFRRWSMVSLTIFSFQAFTFIPVLFFKVVLNWDVFAWNRLNLTQTLVVAITSMIWWDYIIRYWQKHQFKGSLEWMLLKIYSLKRISSNRTLDVHQVVYNVDPLLFTTRPKATMPILVSPSLSSSPE